MGCFLIGLGFLFIILAFSVSPVLGVILIIGLVALSFYLTKKDNENKQKKTQERTNRLYQIEQRLENFKVSQKYVSYDEESALLLDEDSKKIAIVFSELKESKIFNYKDILESEIVEDGNTVTKTTRSSQIGGALLGGILAGGVGAIIGGLSGEKKSAQEINKLDLKIIVNDTKKPGYLINFITADVIDINGKPFPLKKDDPKYKNAMNNINHWHSLISVLIRQADKIDEQIKHEVNKESQNDKHLSIADELKKLVELRDVGILTEEEFNNQKQKLLSQ